ncbi:hypothetical protein [Hamadaea tsunoensis]|uniref:hypothetical protein n=1 Tax=Hamadaea tsunoensis TaxID=53368 RepID=UPI000419C8CB|nr:hypothetical protein [Hamadaea tsunoensis]
MTDPQDVQAEGTSQTAEDVLAARYRKLLRWYPADHRDHYEEEMIGVLLDDAAPGRRRPTPAEAAVLVVTGLRTRITGTGTALGHPRWREGAAVAGVLLVLGLAVKAVHPVAVMAGFALHLPRAWGAVTPEVSLLAAVWAVAAVLVLTPLRRTAAVAAWVAAAAQAAVLGVSYLEDPVAVLDGTWVIVASFIAALGLTVAGGAPRLIPKTFAIGAVLAVIGTFCTYALTRAVPGESLEPLVRAPFHVYLIYNWRLDNLPADVFLAAAAIAVLLGLRRLAPAVRLRLAAFVAPPVALIVVVHRVYAGFAASSPRFDPPVLLTAGEWAGLVLVPLVTFLLAAAFVHRVERLAELVELGRAARRR